MGLTAGRLTDRQNPGKKFKMFNFSLKVQGYYSSTNACKLAKACCKVGSRNANFSEAIHFHSDPYYKITYTILS